MTVQLRKSTLPADFEQRVETFRQQLLKHRFTMDEPVPTEEDLIEGCIQRVQYPVKSKMPDDFIVDYTIIDDTPPPPPPPTLQEKKLKLHFAVIAKEQEHCNCILPPGKARLYSMQYQDIMSLKTTAILNKKEFVFSAKDQAFTDNYEQIMARLDKAHRDVAHILAEIEDLTEDNIDSWVPPSLS